MQHDSCHRAICAARGTLARTPPQKKFTSAFSPQEHAMAKPKRPALAQPLALELLMTDHRKVEDLFSQYDDEKAGDDDTGRQLAQRVCTEIKLTTQLQQ